MVDDRLVLALVPASSDRLITYEVSIAPCVGDECPVEISLVEQNAIVDRTRAEWAASTREPVTEDVERGWGAGDPVAAPPDLVAWATGEEEQYVSTAVRPVRLASNLTGVLIDQRSGFEHVKRHHALFVATGRRIERVWNIGEGAGPEWTSVAVVPVSNAHDAMVLFRGLRYPGSDRADSLSATIHSWDQAEDRLVERAVDAEIHAAIIGDFASIGAARKAKSADTDCLGPFWVLPHSRFADRQVSGFVLALPSMSTDQARAAAACAENRKPTIVQMH
jgi:hypothetical protein